MATPRKTPLRAVKAGETSRTRSTGTRKASKSVAQAAAAGDHRELLVAMRERIARAVSDASCPPRDLAALTRRLQEISKEVDAIDHRAKEEARENGGATEDEAWDEEAL